MTAEMKAAAYDRVAKVVERLDKRGQIDMDSLVDGLSDIRDIVSEGSGR